jgi:hypothetical protein
VPAALEYDELGAGNLVGQVLRRRQGVVEIARTLMTSVGEEIRSSGRGTMAINASLRIPSMRRLSGWMRRTNSAACARSAGPARDATSGGTPRNCMTLPGVGLVANHHTMSAPDIPNRMIWASGGPVAARHDENQRTRAMWMPDREFDGRGGACRYAAN